MHFVTMIPARGGSKGIPKKNIQLIAGNPLIYYSILASIHSNIGKENTWVVSDSEEILSVARECGVNTLLEPDEMAGDNFSIDKVMVWFAEHVPFDVVIMMQPTSPMVHWSDINRAIEMMEKNYLDSVFSVINTDDMLIWNTVTKKALNYNPHDRGRRQDRISNWAVETGSLYAVKRELLLETGCRIGGKIGLLEIDYWRHFQVDSIADLDNIDALMKYGTYQGF